MFQPQASAPQARPQPSPRTPALPARLTGDFVRAGPSPEPSHDRRRGPGLDAAPGGKRGPGVAAAGGTAGAVVLSIEYPPPSGDLPHPSPSPRHRHQHPQSLHHQGTSHYHSHQQQQHQSQQSPRKTHHEQQQQQQQQQWEELKTSSVASRSVVGRSPRNRFKTAAAASASSAKGSGHSAPSTPRSDSRDKSRDRDRAGRGAADKSTALDSARVREEREKGYGDDKVIVRGGGGGRESSRDRGTATAAKGRRSRSLNRTLSKRLSSAPPTGRASSRAASEAGAELSVDARAPGVIRLFGESVVRGAQYKAVLASTRSSSQELVKQALERYGLPPDVFPEFVLCDVVGILQPSKDGVDGGGEDDDDKDVANSDSCKDGEARSSSHVVKDKDKANKDKHNSKSKNNNDDNNDNSVDFDDDDEADNHSDPSYASIGASTGDSRVCVDVVGVGGSDSYGADGVSCSVGVGCTSRGGWTPVSWRALDDADRPLELQRYWKPPEGLCRRFELRRRDDVTARQRASVDDTFGLNDNARRIMMAKVPPGAIPALPFPLAGSMSPEPMRRTREGSHYSRPLSSEGLGLSLKDGCFNNNNNNVNINNNNSSSMNNNSVNSSVKGPKSSPDCEARYAYTCPSMYPYLLTLRGRDIQMDQVLYPLKSKTVSVGRSHRRSHPDDIGLVADDVLDLHCRVHLKTLPADSSSPSSPDRRRYWYCLQVEVLERALVFVNGLRVERWATVQPGDLVGFGHHYLFLYKDPTGGYDIPDTLPWYPGPASLYAKVNKAGCEGRTVLELDTCEQEVLKAMVREVNSQEYYDLDDTADNASTGDVSLSVPYPQDREGEVLEHIASISCSSPADFPLTTTVLMMGCHGYASRRFPPSHQAGFFRRLLRAIRNRVSAVSKALSVQKYQSNLYAPQGEGHKDDSRDGDPLLELLCWLSNVVCIYNHVNSDHFRSCLGAPQASADVTESLQELCDSLEEMISFMFQQTVYSITKVLFAPVGQILLPPGSPSGHTDNARAMAGMERVLHVLRTTLDVSEDVNLHRDVIIQLLTYLIFFVTTTLFNKLMAKGVGTRHFCWSVGVRLQACVSCLEDWVSSMGLEEQYLRVSERLLSLVDLLATSRHTLLRMDWPSFRRQYSPLSESQLLKVLTEYQFTEGQSPPASWLPPPGVQHSDDVSISLSSHPAFSLPRHGPGVDLTDTFPPVLLKHLEDVTALFARGPPQGEVRREGNGSEAAVVMSASSDPGGVPSARAASQSTFFTSADQSGPNTARDYAYPHHRQPPPPPSTTSSSSSSHQQGVGGSQSNGVAQNPQSPPVPQRHKATRDDGSPPPIPPKLPPRCSTIHFADPPVQPFADHRTSGGGGGVLSPRSTTAASSALSQHHHHHHQQQGSHHHPHHQGVAVRNKAAQDHYSTVLASSLRNSKGHKAQDLAPSLPAPPAAAAAGSNGNDGGGAARSGEGGSAGGGGGSGVGGFPKDSAVKDRVLRLEQGIQDPMGQSSRTPLLQLSAPSYPPNTNGNNNNNNNSIHHNNTSNNNHKTNTSSSNNSNNANSNHSPPDYRTYPPPPPHQLGHSAHPSHHDPHQQQHTHGVKRDPPPYHKVGNAPHDRHPHEDGRDPAASLGHSHTPRSPKLESRSPDPRRRPLNGLLLPNGALTLQDKRLLNNVPPLDIPSSDLSTASDSAVSDDVFVQSCTDIPPLALGSSVQSSDFRRFSTGMLSKERSDAEDGEGGKPPEVVKVDMRQEPDSGHVTVEKYPDDIYIDVVKEVDPTSTARQLKVLPLDDGDSSALTNGYDSDPSQSGDAPRVRYRHKMPQERDCSTKGEITGEVFTLTLLKEGSRLGMGLIDGMYTPLKLPGIYVRNVLPGTPAALCGHIRVGDRILAVNGRSIVGADYSSAMKLIRSTGPRLNLLIAKCDRSVTARISAS